MIYDQKNPIAQESYSLIFLKKSTLCPFLMIPGQMKKVFHTFLVSIAENIGSVYKKNNNILHLRSQVSFCTILQEYHMKKICNLFLQNSDDSYPELSTFFL